MATSASSIIGASLSGSSSTSSTLDQLVSVYKQSRQSEVDTLTSKEQTLENKQVFYNTLRTKINSMISGIDNVVRYDSSDKFDSSYISTAQEKFNAKTITSSDSEYVTATATGSAAKGINLVKVDRLATNDVLVTKQTTLADSFGGTTGTKTFTFNAKDEDDDTYKNVDVKVTFDGTETNEQALKKIVSAVNANSDLNFSASLIKDSSTTGRLTLTSKNSGAENKINIVSMDSDVKTALGMDSLSNDANRNPTTVDKKGAYFRVSNTNDLDSQFQLNGIAITRSSNSVDDALQGVTINLLKKQADDDSEVSLTSDYDMSKVQSTITSFISN
jgi:flagellar hook-associated protein 2